MAQKFNRDDLVARLVRAGELEVSGEAPDEVGDYFAPDFRFHGPGGFESEYAGLTAYFNRCGRHSMIARSVGASS